MKALTAGEMNDLIIMQMKHRELSMGYRLVGITNEYIQLSFKCFMKNFEDYQLEESQVEGWKRLYAISAGAKFITVCRNDEWDEYQKGLST